MIRRIEPRDIPRLKELMQCEWTFGPDFMDAMVYVDYKDRAVAFVGAWKRAEVHAALDGSWGTPGMREVAFEQLHAAMEKELKRQGVGEVVTWMDGMKAFCRRLKRLGWGEPDKKALARRLNG